MDIHFAQAPFFPPSDLGFGRDGIVAETDPNVETMRVSELDLAALHAVRSSGSVTPRLDRRPDLFRTGATLSWSAGRVAYPPPEPTDLRRP